MSDFGLGIGDLGLGIWEWAWLMGIPLTIPTAWQAEVTTEVASCSSRSVSDRGAGGDGEIDDL